MNSSDENRRAIFNRIQNAIGDQALSSACVEDKEKMRSTIEEKFKALTTQTPKPNVQGVSASDSKAQLIHRFCEVAQATTAKVKQFDSINELPLWLTELSGANKESGLSVYVQQIPQLQSVNWSAEPAINLTDDYTVTGQWGVVKASCAIAETGSIVLQSSRQHAIAAGFLPDNLMVLVDLDTLVVGLEDIWPLVYRDEKNASSIPRAVNIVTGPSRTADVEQKVQLGAHGPRALYIALI